MKKKLELKKTDYLEKIFSLMFIFFSIFLIAEVIAYSVSFMNGSILHIWDETDNFTRRSGWNVNFYANYTTSNGSIIKEGNCTIRFQNYTGEYGPLQNMTYSDSLKLFIYNRTFNYKGDFLYEINCTNGTELQNINSENFSISNSIPVISKEQGSDWIDIDGNNQNHDALECVEDIECYYDFKKNVTEPDVNDVLSFSYGTQNTTLTNYSLNATTGLLLINVTHTNNTGTGKKIELRVKDDDPNTLWQAGLLDVSIIPVNDAPLFLNLVNFTTNHSQLFEYVINTSDEENDFPFNFTIQFISCTTAEWSDRASTNCELFTADNYTINHTAGTLNITFFPTRNDVGSYLINISVRDSGTISPVNASRSQIINFTVLNINEAPIFNYVCNNERNASEDSFFNCHINATDFDEVNNLTFSSNVSWFLDKVSVQVNKTTNYSGNASISFTPTDAQVGNWSIQVTVEDTGNPKKTNTTSFYFYVSNKNDSVILHDIQDILAYTSNNYTLYINASDDDLLIKDKREYNESLFFTSNNSNLILIGKNHLNGTNLTTAIFYFVPTDLGIGVHWINLTVRDANNYSSDSKVFKITVMSNTPPQWNPSLTTNYLLTEDVNFYLNLTANVTDSDGDSLIFFYKNESFFPSFKLNSTTGIINFTPIDLDIGEQIVVINASDGISQTPLIFNFTVLNVNDPVFIEVPFIVENATTDANLNINMTEDNLTTIVLIVQDDDLKIPSNQKRFYNETISAKLNFEGPNNNLFNFTNPNYISGNRTSFTTTFTPLKKDIGFYNVTLTVNDSSGNYSIKRFNITVFEIQHPPKISPISNIVSSIFESIFVEFNATDAEDINKTFPNSNLTFSLKNLSFGGDFLKINSTSGIINFSFNQSHAGFWKYKVIVNDSSGLTDETYFNLTVYDYPILLYPNESFKFNMKEEFSSALNLSINHTVQDNVTLKLFLNGIYRNTTLAEASGKYFVWHFTPNYTDETTCTGVANLTLNISNPKLSRLYSWNATINHTNAPLNFSGYIGGSASQLITGESTASVFLSDYFSDIDLYDNCSNQSIGFGYILLNSTGSSIDVSITNWSLGVVPKIVFSSTENGEANYTVIGYEYDEINGSLLRSVYSNNFTVRLNPQKINPGTSGGTGGGGGTSSSTNTNAVAKKIVSLKIIVPGPISAKKKDKVIIPIGLYNNGNTALNETSLRSYIAKNGILRKDIIVSLDKNFIPVILPGKRENVTLIADINAEESGLYEITINATVKDPEYEDWGKFYINIEEGENIKERIIFTEEFIESNPQCAEIKEIINEAKRLMNEGKLKESKEKVEEAIMACQRAITQSSFPKQRNKGIYETDFFVSFVITLIGSLLLGISYYYYKRRKLKRKLNLFK